jgi:signal transduction histidine kinase
VVEVVVVGDCPIDDRVAAAVQAAREAMVNAARFAGTGRVDVFAECGGGRLEVFVRDRGAGFDPDAIPADRRGVRESIVGRMARAGGRAAIHTATGSGTEVELVLEDVPA